LVVYPHVNFDDEAIHTSDTYTGTYIALDTENFRIISNRLAVKTGIFKVDQIFCKHSVKLDGVNFLAVNPETKDKVLFG
jgi:hypothetical protein